MKKQLPSKEKLNEMFSYDGGANISCMSCDKFECSEMGPCVKFSYAPGSDEAEKVKAGDLFPGIGAVGEACANLAELCDDQESAARFIRAPSNAEITGAESVRVD